MSFIDSVLKVLFPDWEDDGSYFNQDSNNFANDKSENENNENEDNIEKNITLNLFVNIYKCKHNKENHSCEKTVH